mgnify:CR=1 FL=1
MVLTLQPALLACLSYAATAVLTLRNEQHKSVVERVNTQLNALYGPLLACVTASKSSYDAMIRQFENRHRAAADAPAVGSLSAAEFRAAVRRRPSGPEATAYRAWVRAVLMPLSVKAANLVIERADLLEGDDIDPILLQLVAHVSAYRVILEQWDKGEVAEHSAISFPEKIHQWVSEEFGKLKRRQAVLLGMRGGQSGGLRYRLAARL